MYVLKKWIHVRRWAVASASELIQLDDDDDESDCAVSQWEWQAKAWNMITKIKFHFNYFSLFLLYFFPRSTNAPLCTKRLVHDSLLSVWERERRFNFSDNFRVIYRPSSERMVNVVENQLSFTNRQSLSTRRIIILNRTSSSSIVIRRELWIIEKHFLLF